MEAVLSISFTEEGIHVSYERLKVDLEQKPSGSWIVYSPDFKTIGYSKESKEEAIEDFRKALRTFFKVHFVRGSLGQALTEFGWKQEVDQFHGAKRISAPAGVIERSVTQDNFNFAIA